MIPSSTWTVGQVGIPAARALMVRLAAEPWTHTRSPTRAWSVGITNGWFVVDEA